MSRIHLSKNDVTILKDAFPKKFKAPLFELINMPEEMKNETNWRTKRNRKDQKIRQSGPFLTDTPVGKEYRQYVFDRFQKDFDLVDKLHPNYKGVNGVYWGDFILNFPAGQKLWPHRDSHGEHSNFELRFNTMIQKPENGGVYTINEKEYHLEEGDIIVFAPFHNTHETSQIDKESRSRILVSLSFQTKYFKDFEGGSDE